MFHPTLSSPAGSLKDLPRAEGQRDCGGGGATRFRVNFINSEADNTIVGSRNGESGEEDN